jgi:hypothetical protein
MLFLWINFLHPNKKCLFGVRAGGEIFRGCAASVFRVSGQGAFLYFSGEGKSGGRFPSLQVSENFRGLQPEGEAALVGFSGAVRARG